MYMLRKAIFILIFIILSSLTASVIIAVANNSDTSVEVKTITPSPSSLPTSTTIETTYEVVINISSEEQAIEPAEETTIIPSATILDIITNTPKATDTITATPSITNTPKPTNEPTATPSPTVTPTPAPNYTLNKDSYFISEVLRGVNNERAFEGVSQVYLCDELTELAEQHAIAMALQDGDSFHSDYFYVESVRSGAYISGFMEGVGAAGHATQLAMDEDIIRIGIGSATSRTGKVFTCVLGGRDPSVYN